MSDNKMREAFEKAFPLPSGIFWNEFAELYDSLPGCASLSEEWQAMFKGYMGALIQQPESEPVYQLYSKLAGAWDDVGQEEYDTAAHYRRRVLYTSPQPSAQVPVLWISNEDLAEATEELALITPVTVSAISMKDATALYTHAPAVQVPEGWRADIERAASLFRALQRHDETQGLWEPAAVEQDMAERLEKLLAATSIAEKDDG